MPINVRQADRDQLLLMPPSVAEWLPADHLSWFIVDVVAELDLAVFYSSYRDDGRGGATYDPALMLGVLLYAYAIGERSSRRIERRKRMLDRLASDERSGRLCQTQGHDRTRVRNIKANLRCRRFSRRGLAAATSEWRLICAVHNLLKVQRHRIAAALSRRAQKGGLQASHSCGKCLLLRASCQSCNRL